MALVDDRRRTALFGVALAALTAALWYALESVVGAAAIVAVVALAWTLATAVYAFAAGELLFVLLATGPGAPGDVFGPYPEFLAVQTALGGLLVAATLDRWPPRSAAVTAAAFAVGATALAGVYRVEPTWHGVAALAAAYGITAYGLHRYELVRLDLVAGAD